MRVRDPLPESETPPDARLFCRRPTRWNTRSSTARRERAFAGRFREVAGRALLLPRRRPGQRTALWQQRKRAADLLAVASRYGSFPIVLETYRECLRDVFDMPALVDTLSAIARGSIRVVTADTETPSPFAASLLFTYVATFLYDGDAPLAERRAQALAVDHAQLRSCSATPSCASCSIPTCSARPSGRSARQDRRARSVDVDVMLLVAAPTREIAARVSHVTDPRGRRPYAASCASPDQSSLSSAWWPSRTRRDTATRWVSSSPQACRRRCWSPSPIRSATSCTGSRARTGPSRRPRAQHAWGCRARPLRRHSRHWPVLAASCRGSSGRRARAEWCGRDVLGTLRERSLARLRKQVEPVDAGALGRFVATWQGVARRRAGLDALLDVVEQLQGAPVPASELEREILPARVEGYRPADLDRLVAAGEVAWIGLEPSAIETGASPCISPTTSVCCCSHATRLPRPISSSG
jgi:ATP-dependent Lhr-like helicase